MPVCRFPDVQMPMTSVFRKNIEFSCLSFKSQTRESELQQAGRNDDQAKRLRQKTTILNISACPMDFPRTRPAPNRRRLSRTSIFRPLSNRSGGNLSLLPIRTHISVTTSFRRRNFMRSGSRNFGGAIIRSRLTAREAGRGALTAPHPAPPTTRVTGNRSWCA